jgi:hypothetical protein
MTIASPLNLQGRELSLRKRPFWKQRSLKGFTHPTVSMVNMSLLISAEPLDNFLLAHRASLCVVECAWQALKRDAAPKRSNLVRKLLCVPEAGEASHGNYLHQTTMEFGEP